MLRRALRPRFIIAAAAAVAAFAGAAHAGFRIVSPDWVAEHADDPAVCILDARTSVSDYQYGHVPNAVFLANDALRGPRAGVPVQYLDPPEMAALFRRAGIDGDQTVVVYADGKEVLGATMVAYGLQRVGHHDVAILDGGIEAYREAHPLTQAYPPAATGSLSPRFDASVRVTLEELKTMIGREGVTILDTRPAADYLGNTSRWIRNGHIPGAVNLEWTALMRADNVHAFRSVEEMRRLIGATGARRQDEIVVYCGTSREATLVYQVMKHLLAYPRVRLYEGSWTEYAAQSELPVQREPARMVAAANGAGVVRPDATPVPLDSGTREAMLAALDDERRALAFYGAIIGHFGERRPFSNIIRAERRHEEILLALFERHDIDVPANPWTIDAVEIPPALADACRAAVEFERDNAAMYDDFLTYVRDPQVRAAMIALRDASANRHLPALERFLSRG